MSEIYGLLLKDLNENQHMFKKELSFDGINRKYQSLLVSDILVNGSVPDYTEMIQHARFTEIDEVTNGNSQVKQVVPRTDSISSA